MHVYFCEENPSLPLLPNIEQPPPPKKNPPNQPNKQKKNLSNTPNIQQKKKAYYESQKQKYQNDRLSTFKRAPEEKAVIIDETLLV